MAWRQLIDPVHTQLGLSPDNRLFDDGGGDGGKAKVGCQGVR